MNLNLLPFFFFSTGLAGLGVSTILISSRKHISQNLYLSLCVFSLSMCSVYNFCYTEGALIDLLKDSEKAAAIGERGRAVFDAQAGATARAVQALMALLEKRSVAAR